MGDAGIIAFIVGEAAIPLLLWFALVGAVFGRKIPWGRGSLALLVAWTLTGLTTIAAMLLYSAFGGTQPLPMTILRFFVLPPIASYAALRLLIRRPA